MKKQTCVNGKEDPLRVLTDLLSNRVLLSAFGGWLTAQVLKMLIELLKGGFSLKRLAGGGGMPSSHSATVTGLMLSTGFVCGFGSPEFAIALFLAIIVMYDAMGVRYETGKEAKILNRLRRRDQKLGLEPLFSEQEADLEEKMGHTVPEIAAGILIGILSAVVVCMVLF